MSQRHGDAVPNIYDKDGLEKRVSCHITAPRTRTHKFSSAYATTCQSTDYYPNTLKTGFGYDEYAGESYRKGTRYDTNGTMAKHLATSVKCQTTMRKGIYRSTQQDNKRTFQVPPNLYIAIPAVLVRLKPTFPEPRFSRNNVDTNRAFAGIPPQPSHMSLIAKADHAAETQQNRCATA